MLINLALALNVACLRGLFLPSSRVGERQEQRDDMGNFPMPMLLTAMSAVVVLWVA
jgi:hypothetical protein